MLSVGSLIERRGFNKVIEALPLIIEEFTNIVYLIKGEGLLKEELKYLVKEYHLNDKVMFLDDVSYEELPQIYNAADIFLMPNRLAETGRVPRTLVRGFLQNKKDLLLFFWKQVLPVFQ